MDSFHEQMEEYSFTYFEPEHMTIKRKIGSGGSGEVYVGTLNVMGDVIDCVFKKVSNQWKSGINRDVYQSIIDEVDIGHMFMSKSKHLIQFYGYSVDVEEGEGGEGGEEEDEEENVSLYLIMEKTDATIDFSSYLGKGEFWKILSKQEHTTSESKTKMCHVMEDETKYWDYIPSVKTKLHLIRQVCLALQELHSFKVVHCDLKTPNMLYTGNTVKIIDFGASQKMNGEKIISGSAGSGTDGYMPKELYDGWISYQSDIYSLGVCMLEIWFGDIWPSDSEEYDVCRGYVLDYLRLLKKDNVELHSLIKRCVSTEPNKRPLIKTVLSNLDRIHSTCIY